MSENVHTISDLYQMQALPLNIKISMTKRRIRDWVNEYGLEGVYVSFSGGKDSTVLLTIAREMYPNIKAVFVDTGLEYPEIKQFVKTFDNVDWVRPKKHFKQVCEEYGFPIISKEVSECARGARKYLKSILTEIETGNTLDRPTDRPTVPNHTYMADLLGIDRRMDKENPDYQNLMMGIIPSNADIVLHNRLKDIKNGNKNYCGYEVDRIVGACFPKFREMVDEMKDEDVQQSPAMFKILLGKYPHKENGKLTNEYSSMYDKSRWKFFLDAPFEISNLCCKVMKKEPVRRYGKETGRVPITAQMASESKLRTQKWLKNGCNAFDSKKPISNPMSFWTEQDVLLYIKTFNISIASVYGDIVVDYQAMGQCEGQMSFADFMDMEEFELERPLLKTTGCQRTGCILCGFGCHLEKGESRFERLAKTHPKAMKAFDVIQNSGVTYREAIEWINQNNGKGNIIKLPKKDGE